MSNKKTPLYVTIADAIREEAAGKVKDGVLVGERAIYDSTLPKGVTPAIADKVNNHNVDFLAATGLIVGELGHASGESELSASFEFGAGNMEHLYQREVTIAGEVRNNYMTSTLMHNYGDDSCAIAKVHKDIAELINE